MVVLRKDTAKRKLRVKKHVFSLKDHPTKKNPEDRTNRCTQERHGKK